MMKKPKSFNIEERSPKSRGSFTTTIKRYPVYRADEMDAYIEHLQNEIEVIKETLDKNFS